MTTDEHKLEINGLNVRFNTINVSRLPAGDATFHETDSDGPRNVADRPHALFSVHPTRQTATRVPHSSEPVVRVNMPPVCPTTTPGNSIIVTR